MQGRLRNESLSVEIETTCRHCDQIIHMTVDSDLRISVREDEAIPLVFMPDIDWTNFAERTIIDSY